MTEVEYRILHFDKNCRQLQGKRIFLYGLGRNSRELLSAWDACYHFEALIAPDEKEKDKFTQNHPVSKPVLLIEDAVKLQPDVILIAAQMYSMETIYQRIADLCIKNGIAVFDLYGTDQISLHNEIDQMCYQDLTGWLSITKEYDFISIELTDTVIFRDLFQNREPGIRPVMKQLLKKWKSEGKTLIGIASDEYAMDRYQEIIARESEITFDEITVREHTERFFRDLGKLFSHKKKIHIGKELTEDVLIPRLCGWDSYRMIFFDSKVLLGYKEDEGTESFTWKPDIYYSRIDTSPVISFDVFDTLLTRGTHTVSDVFEETSRRALEAGFLKTEKERRAFEAEREKEQSGNVCLKEIYHRIGTVFSLSEKEQDAIRKLEIKTEFGFLSARKEGAELFSYAVRNEKTIVLITDMYFTSEELNSLLEENGFSGIQKIFVSCEYGLTKHDGLFQIAVKDLGIPAGSILHIGDSLSNDCIPAHRAGVGYLWMPKGTESEEKRLYAYGFLAMAPLIHLWMNWFILKLKDHHCEKVLFSARDGWLLQKIYMLLKLKESPEGMYFYTSRRAAFLPSCSRKETLGYIKYLAGDMPAGQILRQFYLIDAEGDGKDIDNLFHQHFDQIKRQAESFRKAQACYWKKCSLEEGKTYAFVDFVSSGTVKRLLEEVSPFMLKGFYFGTNGTGGVLPDGDLFLKGENEQERSFLNRYIEMEFYMTSPEPSLLRFENEGDPVFADEVRTPEVMEKIKIVQQSIMDYYLYLPQKASELSLHDVLDQYLLTAGFCPAMEYFDDWTGKEIVLHKKEGEDL